MTLIGAIHKASMQDRIQIVHARTAAIALTAALSATIYGASLRQEFFIPREGMIIWQAPMFIYAALILYLFGIGLYFFYILRGQLLAALLLLCPLLAFDTTSRILFVPVLPAAFFAIVATAGAVRVMLRRGARLVGPVLIFCLVVLTYFLAFVLRGGETLNNSDLKYVSYAALLIFASNAVSDKEDVIFVLITLSWCVTIAVIPDLLRFFGDFARNASARLSYLVAGSGSNTFAVNTGLALLALVLLGLPVRKKKVYTLAFVAILGVTVLFSGSRWQLFVVASIGLLALPRMKKGVLWLVGLAGLGLLLFYFFGDTYALDRLFSFDDTYTGRTDNWALAVEVIGKYPLLGLGSNRWSELSLVFTGKAHPVHNPILDVFVSGGLLAGLLNGLFSLVVLSTGGKMILHHAGEPRAIGWLLVSVIAIQISGFYYTYLPFFLTGLCVAYTHICWAELRQAGYRMRRGD